MVILHSPRAVYCGLFDMKIGSSRTLAPGRSLDAGYPHPWAPVRAGERREHSAFRHPSLKLYFFGSVLWIDEVYFFLLVFLLLFTGAQLFAVLYGRVWCGWVCPQAVLSDMTGGLARPSPRLQPEGITGSALSQLVLVLVSTVVATGLLFFFVSPYDMLPSLAEKSLGPWTFGSWIFITALVYIDLAFVRQKFCGTICPSARSPVLLFDDRTSVIGFDHSRAVSKGRERGPRTRVIVFSAAFAFVAGLFAYQLYVRVPLDFWVLRDEPQPAQQVVAKGHIMNAYSLVVENRSLRPEVFRLRVAGISGVNLIASPNPFMVPPNTAVKIRISVVVKRKDLIYRITPLRFVLENVASQEIRIEQEETFIYPSLTDKGLEI